MTSSSTFTVRDVRVFDGRQIHPTATWVRVVDGCIDAVGDAAVMAATHTVVDGGGGTLLPGLIDAHVHLLPGCTELAAGFGVTTVIDQFSQPETIRAELGLIAEAHTGSSPARAELRTSSIGATAPGGHPTLAYAPFPYVYGPADAEEFVEARIAEGANHLKLILDDGSGTMLNIPSLDFETIEALVAAAHRHDLVVVAHVSTAAGAVTVTRAGADVLAHVPFDQMTDRDIDEIARAGVSVIATLSIADGFPGADAVMPLLAEPELAKRLTPRWRAVLEAQATRWMPPRPDLDPPRHNVRSLAAAGVPVLAGTDAPNPGLVHGASLHRELQHLVHAGLTPTQALAAATSVSADTFGLVDRGRVRPGARADLVLVDGDPTAEIAATQRIRRVWVAGRSTEPQAYVDSTLEADGISWLQASTDKIIAGIVKMWPDLPRP